MSFFNKLSLQSKILLMLLLASLLSILLTGYLGYTSGRDALTKTAFNQLTSLRTAKAEEIGSYFKFTENHVLTMSEAAMVVDAIKEFKVAYANLNESQLSAAQQEKLRNFYKDEYIPRLAKNVTGNPLADTYYPQTPAAQYLQYHYIAANPNPVEEKHKLDSAQDGSEYSRLHQKYHSRFRNIAEKMGYYDIALVDIETGVVLYNVSKEPDFTADLKFGPYASSNIAKAYQEALKSRDPYFVKSIDFEPYRPSYGNPSAFITTTVFDGNKFIGALIFEISPERINQVMTSNKKWEEVGLGQTGDTYLIGQDYLLRSEPRPFLEDKEAYFKILEKANYPQDEIERIRNVGTPILAQKAQADVVDRALRGETDTAFGEDYRGVPVLGAFQPIQLGDFKWALVSKMDRSEVFQGVRDLTLRLIISTAILIPLFTLGAIYAARLLARPIHKLIVATKRLAAGESDVRVDIKSEDEIGELARSFNVMASNLHTKEQMIEDKIEENERLLLNILPATVAKRLQSGELNIADSFPNVTVMFAEIEGFSELSERMTADKAVALLNELVGTFDETAEMYGVEKLKTIGSSYLAVCGLTIPRVDHAKRMVDFSFAIFKVVRRFNDKQGSNLSLDIGIHSGPVVAGIVGKTKFIYELWGETMNVAKAIHNSPEQNIIQVSQPIYDALQGMYAFEPLKEVEVRGKGKIAVWSVHPLEPSFVSAEPSVEG